MLGLTSVGTPLFWSLFLLGVLVMLALDLGVFHRTPHKITFKEAAIWSVIWVAISLAFAGWIWHQFGGVAASEFVTAYALEKSLSVDNIFVFVVIFRFMRIKREHLHRVLYAGIVGALVLRAIFILGATWLLDAFHWTLFFFAAFLIYTGIKLLRGGGDHAEAEEDTQEPGDNWIKRIAERYLRVTDDYEGPVFFVRRDGRLFATSLFVTLLMVEASDIMFAVDSVPAAIASVPSRDPFLIFTSNVCAILGLRAMFFLLEDIVDRFQYLQTGLGIVLSYVGVKMLLAEGIGNAGLYYLGVPQHWMLDKIKIAPQLSLGIVLGILTLSIVISLLVPRGRQTE